MKLDLEPAAKYLSQTQRHKQEPFIYFGIFT
jgi:hypothetical protein